MTATTSNPSGSYPNPLTSTGLRVYSQCVRCGIDVTRGSVQLSCRDCRFSDATYVRKALDR